MKKTFDRNNLKNYIIKLSKEDVNRVLSNIRPLPKEDFAFGKRSPSRFEICKIIKKHKFGSCFWNPVFKTKDFFELMYCALTACAGDFDTGIYTIVPVYPPNTRTYIAELEIEDKHDSIEIILFKREGKEGRSEVFRHEMWHRSEK